MGSLRDSLTREPLALPSDAGQAMMSGDEDLNEGHVHRHGEGEGGVLLRAWPFANRKGVGTHEGRMRPRTGARR